MLTTLNDNKWIVIVINYNIKWPIARAISKIIFEILTQFIVNDIYRNYEISKKIIIDRNANLWVFVINQIFELFETKHKKITLYYLRTNNAIKQFNSVLSHMLIKYYIDEFIKTWNVYFNQIFFVTRIRIYITIDFSSFYLFYEINSIFSNNAKKFTFVLYDKKINFTLFLNRERVETFKKTITKTKKNKKTWNAKIKNNIFKFDDMILIRIKKFKKFEIDWYNFYEIIRSKILNTYVFKSSKSFANRYLINDNKIKLIHINEILFKS